MSVWQNSDICNKKFQMLIIFDIKTLLQKKEEVTQFDRIYSYACSVSVFVMT